MPTKVKDSEVVALAGAMLNTLDSLRQQGEGAYPPTLRRLAELTGEAPADVVATKAAAKKDFTTRAVPTKVDRKVSLDGPVYFKEDVPKPDPVRELALRVVAVLRAQKQLGADAYPPTLERLVELCGTKASNTLVGKAIGHEEFTKEAVATGKGKSIREAPVVLTEDLKGDLPSVLPALLRYGLSLTKSGGKKPAESTAFTPKDVTARFANGLKWIEQAIERGVGRDELPEGVAWVVVKGKPFLFLADNVRPVPSGAPHAAANGIPTAPPAPDEARVPPRPPEDFAGAFREAFERLDRRNGATNFVTLADLRRALAGFAREEFDTGLRILREAREFTLDSHEGLHGSLSPEERDAGVHESGSLLVYVSRR